MNKAIRLMLVSAMLFAVVMFAVAPAFAGQASQMWKCEMGDEVTEGQVVAMAEEWFEAATKVKGGENLKGHVRFPVAVNAIGEFDVFFEVIFPTFEEWGKFWDNYSGSTASKLEDKHAAEGVICPDSAVWEIEGVK